MSDEDFEVSDALLAIRRVAETRKGTEDTEVMATFRRLKEDNPDKFLARWQSLEADHKKHCKEERAVAALTPSSQENYDIGTKACVALVEKLLNELEAKREQGQKTTT